MPSANGKGRTILEMLTGRNKREITPLEFEYYNPLAAKVGCNVSIDHDEELANINFFIEFIRVYETIINTASGIKKFSHTDYGLRGNSLDLPRPVRVRLRLIPDPDSNNDLGHKIHILRLVDETDWDEGLEQALADPSGVFQVNYDDENNELPEPWNFHRVDQVLEPYDAKVTTLKDDNADGKISQEELERRNIQYWDFLRTDAINPETDQTYTEYLNVEMDCDSKRFSFLRGKEVQPFTVAVI